MKATNLSICKILETSIYICLNKGSISEWRQAFLKLSLIPRSPAPPLHLVRPFSRLASLRSRLE